MPVEPCGETGKPPFPGGEKAVEELGRPALITRSIIAAQTGEREVDEIYTEDGKTKRVKGNPFAQKGTFGAREEKKEQKETKEKKPFVFDFNAWYAKVLYVLLFVLLVFIVFGIDTFRYSDSIDFRNCISYNVFYEINRSSV